MLRFRWENELRESDLGKLPIGWDVAELGERATIRTGKTNVQDAVENGAYPLFDRSGTIKRSSKYLFDEEAVIVPGEGAEFLPKYYMGKFDLHQRTYAIFGLKGIDGKYLYFVMFVMRRYLNEIAVGSTVNSLRLPMFQDLRVPVPPLEEQKRIASVLSCIENLAENKRRQNQILEASASTMFRDWFIDFRPFGGKMPKDWELKPIGEVSTMRNGFSYGGKEKLVEHEAGSFLFVTLNSFAEGGGFKPGYSWVASNRLAEHHFLNEGDLVMTNTHFGVGGSDVSRLLATPALVIFPPGYQETTAVFSHHVTKISPLKADLKEYLYLYLKATWEDSISFATGTGVVGLDLHNFRLNKLVLIPPHEVTEQFSALAKPLFRKMATNQKEMLILSQLLGLLIEPMVLGKLRVEGI